MSIEFTCLSCERTFSIPVKDLLRVDYLSCIGCERPVPVDLLNALKQVGAHLSPQSDTRKNENLWHIRLKTEY